MTDKYTCPVCGYRDLDERPWTPESGGSYEICLSCGFEFGVTDDDLGETYESWRAKWIRKGRPWSGRAMQRPADWDPCRQLGTLDPHE